MSPRVGLLAREFRRCDLQRCPQPSSTNSLSGSNGGRSSLTVAGPRRCCTGLPWYALAGTRSVINLSKEYLLYAGWLRQGVSGEREASTDGSHVNLRSGETYQESREQ